MSGTFEGVGTLQFSPDNKHAYAYSGAVGVAAETTVLQFTTNSEYIVGRLYTGYCTPTNVTDDMTFQTKLNGSLIAARYMDTSKETQKGDSLTYFDIIIPPFSTVLVLSSNISSMSARDMCSIFTGEVGGAIQQTDLEAISDGSNWIKK